MQTPAFPPLFLEKICQRRTLAAALATLPRPWVFTNGVFDVLHRGHVVYLAQARALGGSLIVALNTDASVRRLGKGDDRPLNPEADRAVVMAAQAAVDLVTWFDEDTPLELIGEIRPDLVVKGGDYDMATLPETALVQSWGGQALALPFVTGYSTTQLVKKISAHALRTATGPAHSQG
jgi:rfaE bifunctional protein nucleotidyltransferase chain/domain